MVGESVVAFPDGMTVAQVLAGGLEMAHALHARARNSSGAVDEESRTAGLAEVRLLAPLVPSSVRDLVAFEEHVEGVSAGVEGKLHGADKLPPTGR